MSQITAIPRQDAIKLTNSSSSRLSYLDSRGIVVPTKLGTKRPIVLYLPKQIFAIKAVNYFQKELKPKDLKTLADFLANNTLENEQIVLVECQGFWASQEEAIGEAVSQIAFSSEGIAKISFTVVPSLWFLKQGID